MDQSFINLIKRENSTRGGIEYLYESLSKQEQKCWDEIEDLKITNWSQLFTLKAKKTPEHLAIVESDTDKSYTYKQLDLASEKIKNYIQNELEEYQIGLNYHNSFLFLACLLGINKANCLAILFNNREPLHRQEELASSSNTKVVFGNPIKGLKNYNIEKILKQTHSPLNTTHLTLSTSLDDPAFVIFTSGTSGPSKGALFSHRRMIGAGIAWSLRTGMDLEDNCYIPLPLYHGNALAVAYSSVVYANATAVLRIKFSVSEFFKDINNYKCSHMVYIGELWRYILNRYKDNPNKSLRVIFGNGLNRALWEKTVNQFKIEHVVEHFGATEMPAGALTNWFDIPGYCGYLPLDDPRLNEMVLVDENYHLVKIGEYGEALFLVPSGEYKGYLDSSLDESKLYHELFTENDLWWKSGDLLQSHENGFYTFVERMGDTFRYKGENVACVDVEEAIRRSIELQEVVVYGITLPGVDGKIGMASLVMNSEDLGCTLQELYKKLKEELASYALPYFIKISNQLHQTTSTLKIQKKHLADLGISQFLEEKHYVLINNHYKELDQNLYNKILNNEIGF
jgi:acyl-CoA synthetase (AMP-forming)/AMP-acid ligase II